MMTRTFEEMCAERDPVYAGAGTEDDFAIAVRLDRMQQDTYRDYFLHKLTIRALRNQGQPYYRV